VFAAQSDLPSAEAAIAVRVENLTVLPQSQPVLAMRVRNPRTSPFAGTITPSVPEGWRLTPSERVVELAPGATERLTFSVEGGRESPDNRYPIEVAISDKAGRSIVKQDICVATAPYAKPVIDGEVSDWQDTIPVEMVTNGKKTTIRTCWNRKAFALLVAVEEDALCLPGSPGSGGSFDAVQFSLAARDSTTKTSESDTADRFEYLLVPGGTEPAKCYALAHPTTHLADTQKLRLGENLVDSDVEIVVRRVDNVTYYECSVPWREMKQALQPAEGREVYFSLLVHDPDGTGLRDWGNEAGMWESQRTRFGWGQWSGANGSGANGSGANGSGANGSGANGSGANGSGATFGKQPPHDSRVEWGLCSSRY
jgi:hypothetical protein